MDTPLTKDQEKSLLRLARQAITHYLEKGTHPPPPTSKRMRKLSNKKEELLLPSK